MVQRKLQSAKPVKLLLVQKVKDLKYIDKSVYQHMINLLLLLIVKNLVLEIQMHKLKIPVQYLQLQPRENLLMVRNFV